MSALQDVIDPVATSDPQFPAAINEKLRLRANHLKMLPAIAMQALEVAKDPDCGIWEFAAVIERDVTLASDILRMANSVMFGGRPVMNLHRAVVRVGIRTCKNLIIASSFSSMMKSMTLEAEWIRELLWRHSFTTALLSLHLNRSFGLGFQGEEFSGGLIHDVGRMLLAACLPDQFPEIDPMDFVDGPSTLEVEESRIGTNHCEVGVWFTRKNMLPEPLTDVVRFHHRPERSQQNRRLVALIAACDHMANHLQRCESAEGYEPQTNAAIEQLEEWGVPRATEHFAEVAPAAMEKALHDAAEMLAN